MSLPQKTGFIGAGTIADTMVHGLLAEPAVPQIMVSLHGRKIAAKLTAEFPAVLASGDNQAIVDGCDAVVLAIRPQIAEKVITLLRFRECQKVISVVAATDRLTLLDWIGADLRLTQAIPLPFVARRKGVTAVFDPDTATIFAVLGNAVECETKVEYDLLAAASALMATYFGIMHRTTEWLAENGLPEEKGRAYLAPLFAGLSETALAAGNVVFIEISKEYATKGGLNEQVFRDYEEHGGTRALTRALDKVYKRIMG
ncbi:pyrroline-5-carboxylate reductase [Microvirga aerophila]|uniref:Pyrroline-5-carboxylate reductase n=1 Tax=Microvirga aerophila TaxID=670291 RepID=A0A512C4F4_9HYPH|nr:pyrroline-5-carboxylate reductase [Microvirga aerophila]GEO18957.1 pyrroline-5-carboxylate reductase [Microvirga aerophila]